MFGQRISAKVFLGAVVAALFCLTATVAAAPIRIARLPIIVKGATHPDTATMDALESKIDRAVNVPLNGVLNIVEFLPEGECEEALAGVIADRRRQTGKKRIMYKEVMKELAQKMDADLVVCPVLTEYYERVYPVFSVNHGMVVVAYAGVQITGYDGRTDKVFNAKRSRSAHDDYGTQTQVKALALACMDDALAEAELRRYIPSAKEFIAAYDAGTE